MDLDKLADLARRAADSYAELRWVELAPHQRESWRAAADAVRAAVESTLPALLPPLDPYAGPALRERIIMGIYAAAAPHESHGEIVRRAEAFESYILGTPRSQAKTDE